MFKQKIILLIIATIFSIINTNNSFAEIKISQISNTITIWQNKDITRWNAFNFFAQYYNNKIPKSYKYIKLWFSDIKKWSLLEKSLQKLIYLNLIENPDRKLYENWKISAWGFFRLSEKILGIKINDAESKINLLKRNANISDVRTIKNFISTDEINIETPVSNANIKTKQAIFNDVYNTLLTKHYDKKVLDKLEMLNDAIEWLTKWTNDKHTIYFPPVKSKAFSDSLAWEYEWIGSYVDMLKPGVLEIKSPIPGSPSEKAWLKWWDIVTKVDWKVITKDNSLQEVVSWIKWPSWSEVVLTINRNWKILTIHVTRWKITISNIESKNLNSRIYYIHIKSFWRNVANQFKDSLIQLKKERNINKIVIDLRNDWGWYLSEVTQILSYFVPKWEKTAVVKYHNSEENYISKWYDLIDFNKYKIVILQNSWTASASEILIWGIKDYYKNVTIIGEQSYWKWSVQVMKSYSDWSLLKYTIAKWFTWWTETWIDWIWITPTIPLEFNLENFKKYWKDNQLEKAKSVR